MRVIVLVKATAESERGVTPTTAQLSEMGRFNEELAQAGIMLAGEGLRSSAEGKRVRFAGPGAASTVLDGPFAETKELIAGFWIWQVSSMDEAVEWLTRAPFQDAEVEIRRVYEAADFGDALTPELRAAEERLRSEAAARA